MEQNTKNINPSTSTISEKLRDTAQLKKIVKQAVVEAVEKAQRLGHLPLDKTTSKKTS